MMHRRQQDITGYILAGGRSSRMGRDKALLEINGKPLLTRLAETMRAVAPEVRVVGHPALHSGYGLHVISSGAQWAGHPHLGPIGGILAALHDAPTELVLVVGCDLPHLTAEWLEYLASRARSSDRDIVMHDGLCAIFRKRCRDPIAQAIAEGREKWGWVMESLSLDRVSEADVKRFDPDGLLLADVDTDEEYQAAKMRYELPPGRGGESSP